MNTTSVPLTFIPVYKDYLWGGSRISSLYPRTPPAAPCAESWEISAHPDGESIAAAGPCAGRPLSALAAEHGAALTGSRAPDPRRFPLLFKLIDARDLLSVQVHPNNDNAHLTGGEPKTEMWVVLDHTPGAHLFAGLTLDSTPETLRAALADGTVTDHLTRLPVAKGQALFIPGGLVHAIGAGSLIYEVQQNSNTTYRLFDWNRRGPDGLPRPLHIEQSLKTIDWRLPPPQLVTPAPAPDNATANHWADLVASPFFTLRKLTLRAPLRQPLDGTSFHALFVAEGRADVTAGGHTVAAPQGTSVLIPAAAGAYTLHPETPSTLYVTTL